MQKKIDHLNWYGENLIAQVRTADGAADGKVALIGGSSQGPRRIACTSIRRRRERGAVQPIGSVLVDEDADRRDLARAAPEYRRHRCTIVGRRAVQATIGPSAPERSLVNNAGIPERWVDRFLPLQEGSGSSRSTSPAPSPPGCQGGRRSDDRQPPGGSIINTLHFGHPQDRSGTHGYSALNSPFEDSPSRRRRIGPHNIRCNSSKFPAQVRTPMAEGDPGELPADPAGRAADATEVTNLRKLFLASDESSYCTGGESTSSTVVSPRRSRGTTCRVANRPQARAGQYLPA